MSIDIPDYSIPSQEIVWMHAPFKQHELWHGIGKTGSICELANGELLACWYGGEDYSDAGLWVASYKRTGWSEPVCIYKETGHHIWNPVFFTLSTGKAQLYFRKFFPEVPEPQKEKYGQRNFTYYLIDSTNGGKIWSEPKELPKGTLPPSKCTPLVLKDGSWVFPCAVNGSAYLQISRNEGINWELVGPINRADGSPAMMTEPSIVEGVDGSIRIFLRNRQQSAEDRYVLSAIYKNGLTKAVSTDMPNPDSGIDVIRLQEGPLCMVCNPSHHDRSPLALYLSYDEGLSWHHAYTIENKPGSFAQPSVIQAKDGTLHILYYATTQDMKESKICHVAIKASKLRINKDSSFF